MRSIDTFCMAPCITMRQNVLEFLIIAKKWEEVLLVKSTLFCCRYVDQTKYKFEQRTGSKGVHLQARTAEIWGLRSRRMEEKVILLLCGAWKRSLQAALPRVCKIPTPTLFQKWYKNKPETSPPLYTQNWPFLSLTLSKSIVECCVHFWFTA